MVRKLKVKGFSSTPPVVSVSPGATVTLYAVDAASPFVGGQPVHARVDPLALALRPSA